MILKMSMDVLPIPLPLSLDLHPYLHFSLPIFAQHITTSCENQNHPSADGESNINYLQMSHYTVGFADGEGSFNVSFRQRDDYLIGWKIRPLPKGKAYTPID